MMEVGMESAIGIGMGAGMDTAVLTDKELAHVMTTLSKIKDVEQRHKCMDEVIVGLLRQLCYDKAMDIFENAEKWYA